MAAKIRIKRSGVSGNPTTLAQGELSYSWLTDNGANGGDRLYIGTGTETAGDAANHQVIGGKFFVDMLDHTAGTLTANSAIVVDASSKIDQLLIDNITIDGNTISTSTGQLILNSTTDINASSNKIINVATPSGPNDAVNKSYVDGIVGGSSIQLNFSTDVGTGSVELANSDMTITGADGITVSGSGTTATIDLDDTSVVTGTYGSATRIPKITIDQQGRITFADDSAVNIVTTFTVNNDDIDLSTESLDIIEGEGIDVTHDSGTNTITIAGEDATTANKGIASFSSSDFSVTSGAVSVKAAGITNTQLVNNAVTVTAGDGLGGGGAVSLGASTSLNVNVDNSSIETNADALRVKALGITNAMLAGSIDNTKLLNSTIGVTAGAGLAGGGTPSLGGSTSLSVNVDDASIEINVDTLQVKALGITNGMLAGSIANSKLSNSSVTVTGGKGLTTTDAILSLGDSATLDVNVDDVTIGFTGDAIRVKPGSIGNTELANNDLTVTAGAGLLGGGLVALGGTTNLLVNVDSASLEISTDKVGIKALGVTNGMLAGSIANAKLSNSSVTVTAGDGLGGGGAISLGGSTSLNVNVDNSSIETNADTLRVKALGVTNGMLAGSIANSKLANDTITIGSTGIALGGTSTTLSGLTQVTVDNVRIDGNTVSTTTGALYIDPANVGDSGDVYILGNLTVQGTTTTVNSTEVTFNDTNIVLADSASNAAEADGAGITVNGANATIIYNAAGDQWEFNKDVDITGALDVSGAVTFGGVSIAEVIDDQVAGLLLAGEGIDLTYIDGSNSLTIAAELATITNPGVIAFDSDQFEFYGAGSNTVTIYDIDGGTY